MSKSVEKCKKTNEGNTFHEKYTDPDDSQRFFEKSLKWRMNLPTDWKTHLSV